jgi:sialate O-acetylesterase
MENGRLLWRLVNTAAPAAFNSASDPNREAPYIMKWGITYTARIVIHNPGVNVVTIDFYLFDPDDAESGKKPLISFHDSSDHRIMANSDVGPQVGASGSADVQPTVAFGGMRVYPFDEWEHLKDNLPAVSADSLVASTSADRTHETEPSAAEEKLILPTVFSDHMVLQQNKKIPVWGKGKEGEQVSVQLEGEKAVTTVKGGKWKVELAPVKAGGPYELIVQSKQQRIVLKDVLVGEVWVLSGQSNMQYGMKAIGDPEDVRQAYHNGIRLFSSRLNMNEEQQWDIPGGIWKAATPETVADFSAAGYYMGLELHKKLDVPIGLMTTAVAGTDIYMWMHQEIVKEFGFQAEPKRQQPSLLYNARIAPLQPFAIAGVAWWQGEQNASLQDKNYGDLFAALVKDWRHGWRQGDFPFNYVQLSSYNSPRLPPIRDEQLPALAKTENTGMAVTIDNGESNDIHPRNKKETGYRLSLICFNGNIPRIKYRKTSEDSTAKVLSFWRSSPLNLKDKPAR